MQIHGGESLDAAASCYCSEKLIQHGDTTRGDDWCKAERVSHCVLRIYARSSVKPVVLPLAISGAGIGALFDSLVKCRKLFSYLGFAVSRSMIDAEERRHYGSAQTRFLCSSEPDQVADYSVTSGTFNVCLGHSRSVWSEHVAATLGVLNYTSRLGLRLIASRPTPMRTRSVVDCITPIHANFSTFASGIFQGRLRCLTITASTSSQSS